MLKQSIDAEAEPVAGQVNESGPAEEGRRSSESASGHEAAGEDTKGGRNPGVAARKERGSAADRGQHGDTGTALEPPPTHEAAEAAAGTSMHTDPCMNESLTSSFLASLPFKASSSWRRWSCGSTEGRSTVVACAVYQHRRATFVIATAGRRKASKRSRSAETAPESPVAPKKQQTRHARSVQQSV